MLGISVSGVVAIWLFGAWIFRIAFGEDYGPGADYAWKLALATVPFALGNLLLFHHLARARWLFAVVVAGALAFEAVCLSLVHGSPEQFAIVLGAAGCLGAIGLVPPGGWELLRRRMSGPKKGLETR
jgi:peptidoglycan/LPS O-acetylase OafA/YrhL